MRYHWDDGDVVLLDSDVTKGGPGSGDPGHAGRPGERGGSAPGDAMNPVSHDPESKFGLKWLTNKDKGLFYAWQSRAGYSDYPTSEEINQFLRHGEVTGSRPMSRRDNWPEGAGQFFTKAEIQGSVDRLDQLLADHVLQEDTILYRGLAKGILDNPKIGTTFTDKGFVATSTGEDVAEESPGQFAEDEELGPVVDIEAPAGTHALHVDTGRFADDMDEDRTDHEVVLPRGTKFRVIGITPDNHGGRTRIHLEIVK